jgi:hypothetical protein
MTLGKSLLRHELRRSPGIGINMSGDVGVGGFMYKERRRRGEAEGNNVGRVVCIA